MSNPILLIRFPGQSPEDSIHQMIESCKKDKISNDYHVLVIQDEMRTGEIIFECFNSPHTIVEFEELKKYIYDKIIKKKTNDIYY